MNKLPIDLQRYIFSFDSTYHEHYQYEIMPYLENLWTIKYIYKHNNERGVDLSHLFSGPFATEDWNNGYWIENGVDLDYSHKKAKKMIILQKNITNLFSNPNINIMEILLFIIIYGVIVLLFYNQKNMKYFISIQIVNNI